MTELQPEDGSGGGASRNERWKRTVSAGNAANDATGGTTAIVRGRTGPAACAWGRAVFVGP